MITYIDYKIVSLKFTMWMTMLTWYTCIMARGLDAVASKEMTSAMPQKESRILGAPSLPLLPLPVMSTLLGSRLRHARPAAWITRSAEVSWIT
jgi:hypothetical protein